MAWRRRVKTDEDFRISEGKVSQPGCEEFELSQVGRRVLGVVSGALRSLVSGPQVGPSPSACPGQPAEIFFASFCRSLHAPRCVRCCHGWGCSGSARGRGGWWWRCCWWWWCGSRVCGDSGDSGCPRGGPMSRGCFDRIYGICGGTCATTRVRVQLRSSGRRRSSAATASTKLRVLRRR